MLQKESEAVPEGSGPVHQEEGFRSGQPAPVDDFRRIEEILDKGINEMMRLLEQHLASQAGRSAATSRHGGRRDRKHQDSRAHGGRRYAVQAMHGDSCTAQKVQDRPKTSTSFGMKAESPALPCRDDRVIEDGATASKSCLPSLEMRSPTAAGGLLLIGEASIASKTTYNKTPLRLYSTEETNPKETNLWTSVSSAWYDSSFWEK